MTEIHFQTIKELSDLLHSGVISSVELTRLFLDRIYQMDSSLNAFRLVCADTALKSARASDERRSAGRTGSPLDGIPFAAKDLFDVAGLPTSAGCHLLENQTVEKDATVVARLRAAGMVLLGKTNTVQFAYGGVGINNDHGTPHNPWSEKHHVPGGSSSGSAVAVAAGLVPMALGTDTGGSVRIPAALCGTTGLKTTVGQISRAGVYPLSWSLDSVGPLTRSVEDAALVYECLQGADPLDPTTAGRPDHAVLATLEERCSGLTIAYPDAVFWHEADPEVEAAVRSTKEVMEALGAKIVDLDFSAAEQARALNNRGLIIAAEAWTLNRQLLEQHFDALDPIVSNRMIKGRDIPAQEYLHMCTELLRLRALAAVELEAVDAVLVPTTPITARPVAELTTNIEAYSQCNLAYLRNTAVGNVLNLCGVTLPCSMSSRGLPIALMVYAHAFKEDIALKVANAFQSATRWHRQTPSMNWLD